MTRRCSAPTRRSNDRLWPIADIPAGSSNVRVEGQRGRGVHVLRGRRGIGPNTRLRLKTPPSRVTATPTRLNGKESRGLSAGLAIQQDVEHAFGVVEERTCHAVVLGVAILDPARRPVLERKDRRVR